MSDNKSYLSSEADGKPEDSPDNHPSSQEPEMVVGPLIEITNGLSIRYAEEESFDVHSVLAKADMAVPGAAAVADAVNQYGYALVRFPEGKSWNDLMPRKTPGYEGWSHFATYAENGGVGGGNAAIRQAGLQPAAIANLAMQGAAMALGLAYMSRIDGKLSEISKGIDQILLHMEEDYISRLEGHADVLAEYMEYYEEYAPNADERISVITNTQRIYEKLRGYWRKELRRMERLQSDLDAQGKTIKEADARRLLKKYESIDGRMRCIFGLAVISRQILMQYNLDFSSRRISRERRTILSMRDAYVASRDKTEHSFNNIAKRIKAPLVKTVPRAIRDKARSRVELPHNLLGTPLANLLGAGIGAAGAVVRIGEGVDGVNSRRQARYQLDVAKVAGYIDDTAEAYARELDSLDFRFNKANALLIGPDGLCPLEIVEDTAQS